MNTPTLLYFIIFFLVFIIFRKLFNTESFSEIQNMVIPTFIKNLQIPTYTVPLPNTKQCNQKNTSEDSVEEFATIRKIKN